MLSLALAASLALNPDVSQETIQQTICVKGYSATVRQSTTYTNPIKYRLMRQDGIPESESSGWALDHRIPISLGGHPRSLGNLQLLTAKENSRKSRIEVKLLCYVCVGQMPLSHAQQEIAGGWQAAYRKHAMEKCAGR